MEQPKSRYLLCDISTIKKRLGGSPEADNYIREHIIASLDNFFKDNTPEEVVAHLAKGEWGYAEDVWTLAVNDIADRMEDDMQLFCLSDID